MQGYREFSCFLIGEGSLPIKCAEILLERGHLIHGIISPDPATEHWARERAIPTLNREADLVTHLRSRRFDYLFSIVNYRLLPPEILNLPRKMAINYHDGPLPRYAGVHATIWALMYRETYHAVTWHVMNDTVDSGDILKQRRVAIDKRDTAFALNLKCYEAALRSFADLIDDLARGSVTRRPQDLTRRTYFPRHKRPPAGGTLSWEWSAEVMDAFIRSLDFGPYINPLCLPKVRMGSNFFIVPKITMLGSGNGAAPGTITAIDERGLTVATRTKQVRLETLLTVDGETWKAPEIAQEYGFQEGYRLTDIEPELAEQISGMDALIYKHERFWVKRLEALSPLSFRTGTGATRGTTPMRYASVPVSVPERFWDSTGNCGGASRLEDLLIAAFVSYLRFLAERDSFDVGLRTHELQSDLAGLDGIFAAHVPMRVNISPGQSFKETFRCVSEEAERLRHRKAYARDAVLRHRLLPRKDWAGRAGLPVCMDFASDPELYRTPSGCELVLVIAMDKGQPCQLIYDTQLFHPEKISQMAADFEILLGNIAANPDRAVSELSALTEEPPRLEARENDATGTVLRAGSPSGFVSHDGSSKVGEASRNLVSPNGKPAPLSASFSNRILVLLEEKIHLDVPSADTDLFDTGALDSLGLIELLSQLEAEFDIKIALGDLEVENFRSARKIAGFIDRIAPKNHDPGEHQGRGQTRTTVHAPQSSLQTKAR